MRIGSILSMHKKMKWSDTECLVKKDGMLSNCDACRIIGR